MEYEFINIPICPVCGSKCDLLFRWENRFLEDMCIANLECHDDPDHFNEYYETESSIKAQARLLQNYYDRK